jgi:hypothetical protein
MLTLATVLKRLTQEPDAVADVQFFLDARGRAAARRRSRAQCRVITLP